MMQLFSRSALQFDGTGSITIPDSSLIQVANAFTIVTQFKLSNVTQQTILEKANEYKLEVDTSGNLSFGVYDGTDYEPAVVGSAVSANTWYKVVVVVDASEGVISKTMYVNSISNKYIENTQTGTIAGTTNDLVIANGMSGAFDLFMFYGVAMSENDVASILNNEFIPYNLNVFFSIEEGEGTNIYDVVNDSYVGTVTNGTWTMGKDLEDVYNASSKVVLVRKYM